MGILRTFPKSSGVALVLSLFLAGTGCLRQQEDPTALAKSGYQGCADASTADGVTVTVNAIMPETASEVQIFRNGTNVGSVFPDQSTTFTDNSIPSLGDTYKYSCKAVVAGEGVMGYNQPTVQTTAPEAPTFSGIDTVSIVNKTQAKITWKAPSLAGSKATKFKVYANLETGAHVDLTATPIATVTAPATTYTLNAGLLGDNLNYAFAVVACTSNDLCSGGNVYKTAQTQDDGAPKTVGFASWKGISGGVELTIPWDHSKGEIRKRYIYINKPSNTTGGTNLADYDQLYVVDVQPSQLYNPVQWANIGKVSIVDSKVTENQTHFFLMKDMDSSGQTTSLFQLTAVMGDLTAPVFPGLTSYNLKSGSEDTQVEIVFAAINRQVEEADANGVANYKVYYVNTPYVNVSTTKPNDPCQFGTAWPSLFPASSYAPGAGRIITLTGLTPRTYYRFCLKAVDSAGNESGNQDATMLTSLATWDKTPPQFDGIQSLAGVVIDGLYRIKASYNPATDLSSNVKYYKVHAWVDSPARDVVAQRNIADGWTTYAYLFNGVDLQYDDNVVVKVVVDACDDASTIPGMSADNCTSSALSSALVVIPPDITPPQDFLGLDSTWLSTNLPSSASPANGQVIVKFRKPTWFDAANQVDAASIAKYQDYAGFNVYTTDVSNNITLIKACPCATPGACNTTTDLQCTINNLTANAIYKLHARAYDANGNVTTYLDPAFKSYNQIVKDAVAPTFVSALGVSWNPTIAKAVVTWTAAVDNQDASSSMYYEIYRKKTTDFTAGEKASPPSGNLRGTANSVTTFQDMDQALDSASEKLSGGGKFYYLACARDAQGNKTCDPVTKNLTLNDVVAPSITLVASDKSNDTSGTYKKWYLQFHVDENESVMASLSLTVYAKYSSSSPSTATTSDSLDTNGNNYLNWTYTPDDATNKKGTVRINSLVGSSNQKGYMNYLVVVRDEAGNTSSFTYTASFDNTMTAVSIANSSGTKSGGRLVVVKGTGFSSSTNNNAGVSTRVYFNSSLCTGVSVLSTGVLTCTTPAMSNGGVAVVTVQNPDGTSATISGGYTFTDGGSFPYTGCDAAANASSTTQFAGGVGSSGNPYLICNRDQLLLIGSDTYRATGYVFKIAENLDLSSWAGFAPIGTNAKPVSGKIDGDGHLLSSLSYTTSTNIPDGVGLFGNVAANFQITNLIVMNFNLTNNIASGVPSMGVLLGRSSGNIVANFSNIDIINSTLTTTTFPNGNAVSAGIGGLFGAMGEGNTSSGSTVDSIKISGLTINASSYLASGKLGVGGLGGYWGTTGVFTTFSNITVSDSTLNCLTVCGGVLGFSATSDFDGVTISNTKIKASPVDKSDMFGPSIVSPSSLGLLAGQMGILYEGLGVNGVSLVHSIDVKGDIQIVNTISSYGSTPPFAKRIGSLFGTLAPYTNATIQNINIAVNITASSFDDNPAHVVSAEGVGGLAGSIYAYGRSNANGNISFSNIKINNPNMECVSGCGGLAGFFISGEHYSTNVRAYKQTYSFSQIQIDAGVSQTQLSTGQCLSNCYASAGQGGLFGSMREQSSYGHGNPNGYIFSLDKSALRFTSTSVAAAEYGGGVVGEVLIDGNATEYPSGTDFFTITDSLVVGNLKLLTSVAANTGVLFGVNSLTSGANTRIKVLRSYFTGSAKFNLQSAVSFYADPAVVVCDATKNSANFVDTTNTGSNFYPTTATCSGYTQKTSTQMKDTSANIYQAAGWDFTTVWKWPEAGNNNGYPVLQWMGE